MITQERTAGDARTRPAAVLWDMDGTLVDTEPYWIECEYELVGEHGGQWSEHHAHAIVGMDLRDAARYIREHGGVDLPIDDIVNRLLDGVIERIKVRVPWRPGARRLLRDLRSAGVPCALVTMSWRRFAQAVVDALPADSFDLLITGDEVEHGKPHPEPYLVAARELGVPVKQCVALEDSNTGVRSAVSAGCITYAIPNVVEVRPGPGYTIVRSLTDLDVEGLAGAGVAMQRRRHGLIVAGLIALLAIIAVTAIASRNDDLAAPPPLDIAMDAWAPYWALDVAEQSVAEHGGGLREVSPFWYIAQGQGEIVTPPSLGDNIADQFVERIRAKGAKVLPSIVDGMDPGAMAALLADPVRRTAHVQEIVALVRDGDFDGIDIDYEQFAFADSASTWASTRPNWVAFLTELSAALHDDDKLISVSVPYIADAGRTDASGFWVYDYVAMGDLVDRIRIMAYDYSTSSPGPIAPMSYVETAIAGAKAAVEDHSKLVLGVPLHGYNWPVATSGTCPADSDSGRTSVSQASVADLIARRGGTPAHDPVTQEATFTYEVTFSDAATSCTQTRQVTYVDAEGTRVRIDLARRAGLGGVALWALGYDDDETWAQIGGLANDPDPPSTTATPTGLATDGE